MHIELIVKIKSKRLSYLQAKVILSMSRSSPALSNAMLFSRHLVTLLFSQPKRSRFSSHGAKFAHLPSDSVAVRLWPIGLSVGRRSVSWARLQIRSHKAIAAGWVEISASLDSSAEAQWSTSWRICKTTHTIDRINLTRQAMYHNQQRPCTKNGSIWKMVREA